MTTTTPTALQALKQLENRVYYWAVRIAGTRTSDVPDLAQIGRVVALNQLRNGARPRQALQRARFAMSRQARKPVPQTLPDYMLDTLPSVDYPSTATVDIKLRVPPETKSALQIAIALEGKKRSMNEIINEAINEWISAARVSNGTRY
mgnify:CR=1 FL=1